MSAPKGNQFWKKRSKHGKDKAFDTPEILWEEACEYFQYIDDNPWIKYEAIKGGDNAGKLIPIPTSRPYTIEGLCIFLNVNTAYFRNFELNNKNTEAYSAVITHIKEIIRTQKFEGAAVGAFNANIIARDLGLREGIEHSGTVEQRPSLTKDQIDKLIDKL